MVADRTRPRQWKPGTSDEAWKVIICARDAYDTEQLLSSLTYILTDAGSDTERGLATIRNMTGDQIVTALLAHVECSRMSVEMAIGKAKVAADR